MDIVIKLDPYQLEHCKRHVKENYANLLEEAIAEGTILPDGHGSLIDKDELVKDIKQDYDVIHKEIADCIRKADVLVKADKT